MQSGHDAASEARLVYVSDDDPGIARARRGRRFVYRRPNGRTVGARSTEMGRIAALAIPPAWTDVWICPSANGHIQATGRDTRGRKQYRYHERWRTQRDGTKFERLLDFGRRLPRMRAQVERDLRRTGLPREKVLAALVRLLETTRARIGNESYRRENDTYGLSTLRDRHADVRGERLRLRFVGKGGKEHAVELFDRRLARIVRECQDLPGQRLFQYLDDEGAHAIGSNDVNDYVRAAAGAEFTAKDFRAWTGSVRALQCLLESGPAHTDKATQRALLAAIDDVAERLRNTRSVCRKFYVHPSVLESFERGWMFEVFPDGSLPARRGRLAAEEVALLTLLRAAKRSAHAQRDTKGRLRESLAQVRGKRRSTWSAPSGSDRRFSPRKRAELARQRHAKLRRIKTRAAS